jgi:hypothetical protein
VLERVRTLASLTREERRFFVAAWALAPWASLAIRRRGLRDVLRGLERAGTGDRARRVERQADPSVDFERGERLVRAAFRRTAADERCLPQSVVQYLLHLRWGPTPRLVVGVVRDRLERDLERFAHAWVEGALGPRREPTFAPILELSPGRGVSAPQDPL